MEGAVPLPVPFYSTHFSLPTRTSASRDSLVSLFTAESSVLRTLTGAFNFCWMSDSDFAKVALKDDGIVLTLPALVNSSCFVCGLHSGREDFYVQTLLSSLYLSILFLLVFYCKPRGQKAMCQSKTLKR